MKLSDGEDIEFAGLAGRLYRSVAPGGDVQRRTYVLLHGIGVSHRYLARLHQKLANAADVYTLDLPGFGSSHRPRRRLQVEDYAAFVTAVLAEAGVRNYVSVGHSMGSQLAVELALQEPGQVSGAVLMGPVVDDSRKSVARHVAALTRDAMFSESLSANVIVFADYFRAGLRWYLTELPVMMEYPIVERLAGVTQPVLVLRGANDPIARAPWCARLTGAAPQGTAGEIPGQGHVFQYTAPGTAAETINGWVRAVDGFGVSA